MAFRALFICFLLSLAILAHCEKGEKKKFGKVGKKPNTLAHRIVSGSLVEQFLGMKTKLQKSLDLDRELVIVYGSDEKDGPVGYNLCDIFDLPKKVTCDKYHKMKCPRGGNMTSDASKDKTHKRKQKTLYDCETSARFVSLEEIGAAVDTFSQVIPFHIQAKRIEEVEYIQAMLGLVKKEKKEVVDYTALYWADAHLHLGKDLGQNCEVDGSSEHSHQQNQACEDFKQTITNLAETSRQHCNHALMTGLGRIVTQSSPLQTHGQGTCYIAGAAQATAREAALMLDMGLMTFRGAWLYHQASSAQSAALTQLSTAKLDGMLVHINPVSVEVMEWGLMLSASRFVSLIDPALHAITRTETSQIEKVKAANALLLTSLVEFERAKVGKTFCTAHKQGLVHAVGDSGVDLTFCGKIKESGYSFQYVSNENGEDDGPFENQTLNKVVVGLALHLLNVFSSRPLQLALGAICMLLLLGVFRLCYIRWKRTSTKTF